MHEELVHDVRTQSFFQLICALVLLLPAAATSWFALAFPGARVGLLIAMAVTVTIGTFLHITLTLLQLRSSDPERMSERLAVQPPAFIPIELSKPPLLQALDVLSSLRSHHHLTDGSPCAPRLVIQPIDAAGRCVDPNAGAHHLGTTRALVREPLQFAQAKIRQSVKDPRSLKWEQNAALLEVAAVDGERRGSTASSDGGGLGTGDALTGDVHDFITANYGSALRHAEESLGGRDLGIRATAFGPLQQSGSVAEVRETHGLAGFLEPALYDEAKRLLEVAVARGPAAWDFNAFELGRCTNDHALVFLGHHVFREVGLMDSLGLSRATLLTFLQRVENSYKANPYHNRTHAADVLQASLWILSS